MSAQMQPTNTQHAARQSVSLALAIGVTVPGVWLRFASAHPPDVVAAIVYGLAIVGAAFLLSWAAEVAQLDISAGLAIAVLAFIAVLPEYAVDMVFASKGGNAVQAFGTACKAPGASGESACSLALANMTGANRLLIGLGWSMVVFIACMSRARGRRATARAGERSTPHARGRLERSHAVEVTFLALATAYSLPLPLKHSVTLFDARRARRHLRRVHDPHLARARRGAAPRRAGAAHRLAAERRAARDRRRAAARLRGRDLALRRALRRVAGRHRASSSASASSSRPVARAARFRGARAARSPACSRGGSTRTPGSARSCARR